MNVPSPTVRIDDDEQVFLAEFANRGSLDLLIPAVARDRRVMARIDAIVQRIPTTHELTLGDARAASAMPDQSIHLVVTSPPYWSLKRYKDHADQLGHVVDYDEFIEGLDAVWKNCYRTLVPG
ncbi:MAG: site-specific DNA-methyltransferase, partial [Planctomycetes bacterium]|nr:site-specific DNA-methyltransferase [Planctomycetota bacterium]